MGRIAILGLVIFGIVPAYLVWRLWTREKIFSSLIVVSVAMLGASMGLGKWILGVAALGQSLVFLLLVLVSRNKLRGFEKALAWGVMGCATILACTLLFDAEHIRVWGLSYDVTGLIAGLIVVVVGTTGAFRRKIL